MTSKRFARLILGFGLLLSFLGLAAVTHGQNAPTTSFVCSYADEFDVMIAIDASAVTQELASSGYSRIHHEIDAVTQFLIRRYEPGGDRVGIVSYNDTSTLVQPLTDDYAQVISSLDAISPKGRTFLAAGIEKASQELVQKGRPDRKKIIILMVTSGPSEPNINAAILTANRARLNGARVLVAAIRPDLNLINNTRFWELVEEPEDLVFREDAGSFYEILMGFSERIRCAATPTPAPTDSPTPTNTERPTSTAEPVCPLVSWIETNHYDCNPAEVKIQILTHCLAEDLNEINAEVEIPDGWEFLPGSADPPATRTSQHAVAWFMYGPQPRTFTLNFKMKPVISGNWLMHGTITWKDSDGQHTDPSQLWVGIGRDCGVTPGPISTFGPTRTPGPTNTPGPPQITRQPTRTAEATQVVEQPTSAPLRGKTVDIYLPMLFGNKPSVGCDPETNRIDVALVIDISGSMEEDGATKRAKLVEAVEAAVGFVDELRDGDQVALVTFQSSSTLRHQLTLNHESVVAELMRYQTWRENSEGTWIRSGIEDAKTELTRSRHNPSNQQVMIILSDGDSNPKSDQARAAEAKLLGIRIITVGFGTIDEDNLRAIASGPNDFVKSNGRDLPQIFEVLAHVNPCCRPEQVHADVAIVLDASTSMLEQSGTMTKLEAAKFAAKAFVSQLGPSDQATIISFNSDVYMQQTLTSDKAPLEAAIDRISVSMQTRLDLGVQKAYQELTSQRHKPDNNKVMIVLTDGRANPVPVSEAVARASEAKVSGIRIFTIGLGADLDVDALRTMATKPSDFFQTTDASTLASIYRQVAFSLSCPTIKQ